MVSLVLAPLVNLATRETVVDTAIYMEPTAAILLTRIKGGCLMIRKLPISGIYRLALYSRHLPGLGRDEYGYISSQELADATGHTAAQVRRDITCYGSLGEPGKGYQIGKLKTMLTRIFDKEEATNVVLVGVGNLGMALIAHSGFQLQQFKVFAAFDRDVEKIGKYVEDVLIRDVRDLDSVLAGADTDIAIVAVPAHSAQYVVDKLVSAGIKAILNCAPVNVNVPEGVELQNFDMTIELDRLNCLLKNPR